MTTAVIIRTIAIIALIVGLLVYISLRSEHKPMNVAAKRSAKISLRTFLVLGALIVAGALALFIWVLVAISQSPDLN